MSKKIVGIIGCAIGAVLFFGAVFSKASVEDVMIEGGGIQLVIPKEYVLKKRFWWIDRVEGLDSSAGSAVIQIPAHEIKLLLPEMTVQGDSAPNALTATVTLLGQKKVSEVAQVGVEIASELSKKKGRFSESFITYDEATGWYHLYQSPNIKSKWYVLLHSPDAVRGQGQLKAEDVVALCGRYNAGGTNCNLMTFFIDGIGVETSMKAEHLSHYKKIQEHIGILLRHWLVQKRK